MKKNDPIVKIIIFGAAAVIIYGVGIFTKIWKALPQNGQNRIAS